MENQYLLQLMLSKGIGDVAIKKILHYTALCSEHSLSAFCENPQNLTSIIKCNSEMIDSIKLNAEQAEIIHQELKQMQILIVTENDSDYPAQLKTTLGNKCPPVLFVKGNQKLLSELSVGFCGSRKVSPKGSAITTQCAEQLVSHGITVVSGYAAGTDLSAHISAVAHGGNTIFVLAEGILKYTQKQAIKEFLTAENHAFVSQFLPQVTWSAGNAMRRNSVIIGLSRAMVLVESGKKGGTFAVGEESLRLGQPLFVIDYAKPEVSAEANPYFIEHGGNPIRGKNGIPNLEKVIDVVKNQPLSTVESEQLMISLVNS